MITYMSIDGLHTLEIGHVSDNLTHRVEIDCSAWKRKYPALTDYFLYITEPNGLIYIADTKMDGGKLIWDVSSGDTAIHGVGSYQVVAHGKYGDRRSSKTCTIGIQANMDGMDNADPPVPSKAWVNKVYAARDAAQTAAKNAAKSAETMLHPPIIGENGNWWLWDAAVGEYLDSGFTSRGDVYVNNDTSCTLPTASETVKGGVKVGRGLSMEGETLNAEVTKEDIDALSEEKADQFTVGDGLQMSADRVLSAVGGGGSDGVYELIETITIDTDDVASIVRDAQPDGTRYNYSALLIIAKQPPCSKTGTTTIKLTLTSNVNFDLKINNNQNYPGIGTLVVEDRNGRFFADIGSSLNYSTNSNITHERAASLNGWFKSEMISCVGLTAHSTDNRFVLGTTIEIWGVRA